MFCTSGLSVTVFFFQIFRAVTEMDQPFKMSDQDNSLAPPPKKRRKLSEICGANFLANLSNTSKLEDVTFLVGKEKEKIRGNRTIFALQSSVFEAQLYGQMQEAKSNEIIIEDITPPAFTFLKNIFYGNDDTLTCDIVCDVLYACKKYLLIELECECYKFIENIDKLKDWWKLIQQQQITTDIDMEDALLRKSKVLIKNSDEIVNNFEELVKIRPGWMRKLAKCDTFVVSKEEKIWEMCLNYCENVELNFNWMMNKSVKEKMGLFLECIRFPMIDKDYFFEKIEKSDIIPSEYLYPICKGFVESASKKYKYESGMVWYERTPFSERFVAQYDIKSLRKGDKILWRTTIGKYGERCICDMDWGVGSRQTFKKGLEVSWSSGSQGKRKKQYLWKEKSVELLKNGCLVALVSEESKNESDDIDIGFKSEPDLNKIKSIFTIGSMVQCYVKIGVGDGNIYEVSRKKSENKQDWQRKWVQAKVIDVIKSGWIYVVVDVNQDKQHPEKQITKFYHPWDYKRLRL